MRGYNNIMTIRTRIAVTADEARKTGKVPKRVYLTSDDATQLQYELISEGGQLAHDVMQNGVCKAVSKIHGLTIVWRSQHFNVG